MGKNEFQNVDDRQLFISPGPGYEPAQLIRQFGCYATMLLVALSWLMVAAVMLWQGWPFALWPFGAVPAVAWVVLLAIPLFAKFRRGALTTADAVVRTAEAYAARAGYVVDLNRDGVIGHNAPEVRPPIEEHRPLIVRGRVTDETHQSPRLPVPAMADVATDHVGGVSGLDADPEPPERPDVKIKVWHLPNKERIEQGQLEQFVDGVFVHGWGRELWLKRGMRREVYEGGIMLLEEADILVDRKKGFAGRLSVRNARQARAVLDLPIT